MASKDDRVRLLLDGNEVFVFESYSVSQRFFASPSAFSCRIGSGSTVRGLMAKYPPGTPYALSIGNVLQHTGRLDGYAPEDTKGATEINLKGRDWMAPVHDNCIPADKSFSNITFRQLAAECISGAGVRDFILNNSNASNRKAVSGDTRSRAPIVEVGNVVVGQQFVDALTGIRFGVTTVSTVVPGEKPKSPPPESIRAKCGDRWGKFGKKQFDKAGIFLIAAANPKSYILTEPQGTQEPTFEVVRQRGSVNDVVTALRAHHQHDTTHRYSHYVCYGRGGGGKSGRVKIRGEFVDQEMVDLGIIKQFTWVDDDAKTSSQAEFLARKKCTEDRRQGFSIRYTVKGHTAPLIGGGSQFGIWAIDTVVRIRDDEYGINGSYWIEGVEPRGGPDGTTTELTLHRSEDLVFGDKAAK